MHEKKSKKTLFLVVLLLVNILYTYSIIVNNDIASYGDDAFVVMLQDNSADTVAKKVADQVIERCKEVFWVDDHSIRVTMNIGISCYPSDTQDENSLIKNADMAMIQARNIGINRIQ